MVGLEVTTLEQRTLPKVINYYEIKSDGRVEEATFPKADVYIEEQSVHYFADKDVMLHIRETYGCRVGVMRDIDFAITTPREYRTPKMLLGIVGGERIR